MLKRGLSSSTLNEDGQRVPVRTRPEATVSQLKGNKSGDAQPKKMSILGAGDYENYKPMVSLGISERLFIFSKIFDLF